MTIALRPLSELCCFSVERTNPADAPEAEFWYVDISSVDSVLKEITSPILTKGKLASVRARQKIRENDVLVSTTRPNLNAVAIVPRKYDGQICSTGFCVLRSGVELDSDYLFYFSRSSLFCDSLSSLVQGALYPAVTDKQVFAQTIPWLPVDDQRQIATRLKAQLAEVAIAREAVEKQLRDVRLLRSRLLKAIFAELDAAPQKTLGDCARTTSGSTPSRGDKRYWQSADIPWVKTGEVAFAPIDKTEESISKAALTECSLTLLPPKTILVAMYGQGKTRGQSAMLEIAATTNQACFAILPNDTWQSDFLALWLRSSYQDLRDLSENRGGNQANLNGALLNALQIPAPSHAEQTHTVRRINAALTEIDAIEEAIRAKQTNIAQLPNQILAQAFAPQKAHHD